MSRAVLHVGDVRAVLATLPERSVRCVCTSPPYFGLRAYLPAGHADKAFELGAEPTPDAYVANMVDVFRAIRRVLQDDGSVFLNVGDSYNSSSQNNHGKGGDLEHRHLSPKEGWAGHRALVPGLKPKDLIGIPWMLAFALRADGWYLRSEIIWAKKAPMPESVEDRPTKSHEQVFLLTKSAKYFYDAAAIAEPAEKGDAGSTFTDGKTGENGLGRVSQRPREQHATRNARSVWWLGPDPYPGSHFAVMPRELARRCILAGSSQRGQCPECGAVWERVVERTDEPDVTAKGSRFDTGKTGVNGAERVQSGERFVKRDTGQWAPTCDHGREPVPDVVLDPFSGSGTTAAVATGNGRDAIYIDLNPAYRDLARERIGPMLCVDAEPAEAA